MYRMQNAFWFKINTGPPGTQWRQSERVQSLANNRALERAALRKRIQQGMTVCSDRVQATLKPAGNCCRILQLGSDCCFFCVCSVGWDVVQTHMEYSSDRSPKN